MAFSTTTQEQEASMWWSMDVINSTDRSLFVQKEKHLVSVTCRKAIGCPPFAHWNYWNYALNIGRSISVSDAVAVQHSLGRDPHWPADFCRLKSCMVYARAGFSVRTNELSGQYTFVFLIAQTGGMEVSSCIRCHLRTFMIMVHLHDIANTNLPWLDSHNYDPFPRAGCHLLYRAMENLEARNLEFLAGAESHLLTIGGDDEEGAWLLCHVRYPSKSCSTLLAKLTGFNESQYKYYTLRVWKVKRN